MTTVKQKSDAGRAKKRTDQRWLEQHAKAAEAAEDFRVAWAAGYFTGHTHATVAVLVGVATSTITKILGGATPSLEIARRLSDVAHKAANGESVKVEAQPAAAKDADASKVLLQAIARIAGDGRPSDGNLIAALAELAGKL